MATAEHSSYPTKRRSQAREALDRAAEQVNLANAFVDYMVAANARHERELARAERGAQLITNVTAHRESGRGRTVV